TGQPPAPLHAAAAEAGVRFLGADRPGYGGTTRDPAAGIADIVPDVLAVADALGVARFAVLGHSGGGPRALACAALAADRVLAAVAVASPAPPDADGLDRYRGMATGIVREQHAVGAGRAALEALLAEDDFDETSFTPGDRAALDGEWSWFGAVVQAATADGPQPMADDLLAAGRPWGFDPAAIRLPVRIVHGADDRMVPVQHGRWLAGRVPGAEVEIVPGAGHVEVLVRAAPLVPALRRLAGPTRS
ncbi:alpha/beta fold hydrolase, partial [uncultured Amnibacterium sp.]|uniref:alpha/beta fold hydrolase n=1 Tax=uncultured Amnibacterium sp. TaxID=1631851 RepID=UPI0035CAA759